MKALKIIGYILAGLISLVLIVMVLLTLPNASDPNSGLDYLIVMLATFWIYGLASFIPLIIGIIGFIISLVKRKKGAFHFIIIALAPITLTVLYFLSAYLL